MNIGGEVGSVSITPYEYAAIYEYLGKNRYLQAAFCKSVAKLYSDKFGMYTTKALSNIAAEEGFIGMLEWSKEIGCRWDESLFASGAKGGHVDVLKFLKSSGCRKPYGDVAWEAAAERGNHEVLKFAYDSRYIRNMRRLCEVAASNNHIRILKWVHEEVEGTRNFSAFTCQSAASGGFIEIVQYLRGIGCQWNKTTCEAAIEHGHVGVLKWALDNGCPWDVNDKETFGKTALQITKHAEVIEFLISRGADINAVDILGRTPVYFATEGGRLEAVKTLVRLGADVNLAYVVGMTPLDRAITKGYLEIVEALRSAGARESN